MADVRGILARPTVYELFSRIVGGEHARRALVQEHVRPWSGARVLDLGCGPGELLHYLGDVHYVGVDASEEYISRAKRSFGGQAEFRVGDATMLDEDLREFDLVLAFGVLHHLDDSDAERLLQHAQRALDTDGRFVSLDGAFMPGEQGPAARLIVSLDRGQYVRTPGEYAQLAERIFADVRCVIHRDLIRIPYTHCVLECSGRV
jgi:SAM-dependent methyltransferase